jgi:hypothetical protein
MRTLWQDHGTWTRLAIVSFADNSPDRQATQERLLANQTEIGKRRQALLRCRCGRQAHCPAPATHPDCGRGAQGGQDGQSGGGRAGQAAFYANGNQIADFLHAANPGNWPLGAVQTMMRTHLDQVVEMCSDELTRHYAESVGVWNPYRDHIMAMADTLSNGIIKQFPGRFS